MTIEGARAELDKAIEFYGDCVKDGDTLEEKCHAEEIVDEAIEVYGDARELEGHVAACYYTCAGTKCGDEWYCDKAPRRTA